MTAQTITRRWTRRPEGSNWGDYGADDQVGRLNGITPEIRLAAVGEVKEGRAFVLSLPLDYPGGEAEDAPRKGPKLFASCLGGHQMYNFSLTETDVCCDDGVTMWLQYSTQWDSLAHWGRMFDVDDGGEMKPFYYNGFRAGEHMIGPDVEGGPRAKALGIENMAITGVQGRGVLVDLARQFGTGRTLVGYDKLMQAIATQRVEVRPGDFLLLHTGYGDALMAMGRSPDGEVLHKTGAALDGSDGRLLDWIEKSGIVALIADNQAVESFDPALAAAGPNGLLPLHDRCLFKLGIHLGELWWLSDLARHLGSVGRHAFLLTAPPLRLPGAVGSPATPVATV
ncbi:cyclase family protein [Sphingomonas bacterium]|uniref:cyclase family protein n=1 Tax=Sphingomonas bacterium TaxID=1895847 RepID=UPI001C2D4147|nr:cyclase family protein [Sphingomonas bacterium]